jgi:hypothetical protein
MRLKMTVVKTVKNWVRIYSVDEFLLDFRTKNLYVSSKLIQEKALIYFQGLCNALFDGTDFESVVSNFTNYLTQNVCLTEDAQKRANAAETLAYNELKRYYIRGVCLLAIEQHKPLRICRIRASVNQSLDAEKFMGNVLQAKKMLGFARYFLQKSNDSDYSEEKRVLRPNSGLGVEILDEEQNLRSKGEING